MSDGDRWPGNKTARRGRGPEPRPLDEIHGLRGTFVNRGCRCHACTEANRLYQTNYRRRQEAA